MQYKHSLHLNDTWQGDVPAKHVTLRHTLLSTVLYLRFSSLLFNYSFVPAWPKCLANHKYRPLVDDTRFVIDCNNFLPPEHTNEHGASSEDTRRKEGKKLKSRREIEATPSIPQFAAVTTFCYNFQNFRLSFFQVALFRSFLLRIRSNLQVLRLFFNRIPTGCPI